MLFMEREIDEGMDARSRATQEQLPRVRGQFVGWVERSETHRLFALLGHCLLVFEVACFARRASHFLCLCKESNQRKHTLRTRSHKKTWEFPVLLVLDGVRDRTSLSRHARFGILPSPALFARLLPAKPAMLGAAEGARHPKQSDSCCE
ncbi:hypothetical protein CJD38_09485 [Stenotrophobium rhamnosiphilum]|uniref:Uncharacterized protein n=1 Tax=Stenotrophobium rhamnosiphilum TaxID=2029166 RepID=A0A2T5MG44_9GAMM|nr:hypothetical protein CJD38_09485 [Stenotrophobium rhamnosiphilum]